MAQSLLRLRIAAFSVPSPVIRQRGIYGRRINSLIPSLSLGTVRYHSSARTASSGRYHNANERNEKRAHNHRRDHSDDLRGEALLQDVHSKMRQSLASGVLKQLGPGKIHQMITGQAQRLDAQGVAYNAETYELLLSAYSKKDDYAQVLHLLDDMKAKQIQPSKRFFLKSLHLIARFGLTRLFRRTTAIMGSYGYDTESLGVYTERIQCLCNNNELEHAIDILDTMKRSHIQPALLTYLPVVHAALRLQHPEVASEYLEEAEAAYLRQSHGAEALPEHLQPLIMRVLRCAAINGAYDIVKKTWNLAINKHKYLPDEGLCYYVLHSAAQHSDPALSLDVIRVLGAQGFPYKEAHFAPVVEAYAESEDWKNTLRIFHVMRMAGVVPTNETARPMLVKFGKDPDAIHAARSALLQLFYENQSDVVAFNLLIHAYANNNNYIDAMDLFNTVKELDVPIDINTVDAALDACIHAKAYAQGNAIYQAHVNGQNMKPTPKTLSKMVALACTQDDYEGAFRYLEETKAMGMVPLRGSYYRLVKKLATFNDPRLESAVQEMMACGYEVSPFLYEHLEKHAQQKVEPDETPLLATPEA